MIRQICLNCYKMTELPDDAAGREVTCPHCQKPITVPAKYTPGVAAGGGLSPVPPSPSVPTPPPGSQPMSSDPTAPPGASPVAPPQLPPPAPQPPPGTVIPGATPPPPSGDRSGFGLTLNPSWLVWVPATCFVLAFILSFFPWVRMSLGGYTVLTQHGWDSFSGDTSGSIPSGDAWKKFDNDLHGKDGKLSSDGLIIPYILLLLVTVALAVIERIVKNPNANTLPGPLKWLPSVWPKFLYILVGLSVLLLILIGIQSLRGFGLQHAVQAIARTKFEEKLAANPTGSELRQVWIDVGQEAGKYPVYQTGWLSLLLVVHLVAVLAYLARLWLNARGNKPYPRIGLTW